MSRWICPSFIYSLWFRAAFSSRRLRKHTLTSLFRNSECLMWTSISRAEHIWQKQLIRTSLQFKSIIFQFGLQVKLQSLPETTRLQLNPPRGKRGAFKGSEQQNQPSQHMCAHTQASGCFEKCVCAHVEKQTHTNTISSVLPAWVFPCYLSPQEDSGRVIPAGLQGERSLSLQAQNNKRDENAAFVSGSVESVHHQIK